MGFHNIVPPTCFEVALALGILTYVNMNRVVNTVAASV